MASNSKIRQKEIVLFLFLLISSGLGIAAFIMSFTKKCGEGFKEVGKPDEDTWVPCSETMVDTSGSIFGRPGAPHTTGSDWSQCSDFKCEIFGEYPKCDKTMVNSEGTVLCLNKTEGKTKWGQCQANYLCKMNPNAPIHVVPPL